MKTFLFIVGIILLADVIFYGGLQLGNQLHFMNAMFQVSTLDQEVGNATKIFWTVSHLEDGKVEEAKSFLNVQLNSHINTIGMFLKDCPNEKTRQHAIKLLARIAKVRQEHPVHISVTNDVPGYGAVERGVQEILNKALQEEEIPNRLPVN